MIDPIAIGTWLGILVAIGGVITGSIKFCFWVVDEWNKRKTHAGFSMPRDTLRIATKMQGNCWWHMGKQGDDPTMQIAGSVFATNISNVPVRLPQVELRYGFFGRHRTPGMVMVSNGGRQIMYGMYDIPSNDTRDVSFDFWVYPPVIEAALDFKVHSVTILDQFGNRHVIKNLVFRSNNERIIDTKKDPEEFTYAINDPIKKKLFLYLRLNVADLQYVADG